MSTLKLRVVMVKHLTDGLGRAAVVHKLAGVGFSLARASVSRRGAIIQIDVIAELARPTTQNLTTVCTMYLLCQARAECKRTADRAT